MEDHSSRNHNALEEVDMPMNDSNDEENDLGKEDMDIIPSNEQVDCSSAFTTEELFSSRDDLINWARNIGRENGYVVVIVRSETGGPRRRTFVILGCERSGKYRQYKSELVRKVSGSKKCQCPFKLKGRPLKNGEGWKVKVLCGYHNHPRAETLVGHAFAGRLSEREKSMLADMTAKMEKPKSILSTLKDQNESNVTSIKQIYNARHKFRLSLKGSKTQMQMQRLIKLLEGADFVHWHRRDEMTDAVRDVFWAHPDAIDLLNAFNTVLMIDSTYKAGKYHLPLLEIVGVTSTELTFSVAFAYMESDRADDYIWALQKMRDLIPIEDPLPQVIVTDKDTALMNAVQSVFPSSTHLLCRFHINKNVKAKCKLLVSRKEEWESVMSSWEIIVDSPDEVEFERRWVAFQTVYASFPDFVEYVRDTWLILHKEKFISAWVDKVMHLGNTSINRAEGAHGRLKNMLQNSTKDFCSCWDSMKSLITLQHNEIKSSFEKNIIAVEHRLNTHFFAKLQGFVSKNAMRHILTEYDRVKYVGDDKSLCGCLIRTTHGLPCAHELAGYEKMGYAIPLHVVHPHWRRLNFGNQLMIKEPCEEVCIYDEMEAVWQRFQESDVFDKIAIKNKLREIASLTTIAICPPVEKVKSKGAIEGAKVKTKGTIEGNEVKFKKSMKRYHSDLESSDSSHESLDDSTSSFSHSSIEETKRRKVPLMLEHFPQEIHEYIEDVIDVKADGNCGYRAVAALLGKGEESWAQVRLDLIKELKTWHVDYVQLFGSKERVQELVNSLYVDNLSFVPCNKWMTIPDMGYVIASRYNVVLVYLSMSSSMTFLPLRGPPLSPSKQRLISIGFLPNSHFVPVFLKQGSPIPPVALQWRRYCSAEAQEWETPYVARMQAFNSLFPCEVKEDVTSQV